MNRTISPHHLSPAREWDRHTIVGSLDGLITGSGMWRDDAFAGIARTAAYLDGTLVPGPEEDGPRPAGDGRWTRFIGRTGAVALRAVAPTTGAAHREVLLDFLEMWAGTPFADPGRHFRVGLLKGPDQPFHVRDAHGAAVGVYWPADGLQPFLEARTGEDTGPALPGEVVHAAPTHRVRYTGAWLRALVAEVRGRGPVPWDPDAVTDLVRATGMSRAAAALMLVGAPSPYRFTAGEREVLGLKSAEADDGRAELSRLTEADRIALSADVLPGDPADLWRPGALREVAALLGGAWKDRYGAWPQTSETAWQAALPLERRISAADLCRLFLDPARMPPSAGIGVNPRWLEPRYRGLPTLWDVRSWADAGLLLETLLTAVPWAYAELPAGDPVREGAPELVRFLHRTLARADSPGRLLREGLSPEARRGAQLVWLTGATCDRMMTRIESGALPEGTYESDPRASAPAVVAEAAGHLGLSRDAAALYLQLLVLPSPTDRHVRRWNGWTAGRHREAAAELVERGMVVRDKRPRAGRDVFLPGPWVTSGRPRWGLKPAPPLEGWKVPLLDALTGGGKVTHLPPFPDTLPELFGQALRLVREGNGPAATA